MRCRRSLPAASESKTTLHISRLLEHHRKFAKEGLPGSFGDGYLMVHNRVFRQMREAALKAGYKFNSERNDAYDTFPLLQLENLLQAKVLPYANNVSAFERLTSAQLEVLEWEDIDGNLKKNFVFHEGCHAVVRTLAGQTLGPLNQIAGIESERNFAFRMLLEESCANTAELLGTIDVHDQVHRCLFEMNSYMANFDNRTNLKNAMADLGAGTLIKFMVLSYLQANFLRERIEDRQLQEMVGIAAKGLVLDAKKVKTLRAMAKMSFQLSERFRVQTTGFHLRLAGIKTPSAKLFDFDFLAGLENEPFHNFLNHFANLLEPK